MAAVMRRGKSHLYSYKWTEEIREKTVEDPETGEETTVSEKWMIYTISYNGEDYFADQVFSLSEEQREFAVSGCTPSEPQRLLDTLADGKLVVAIMSKGHFTSGGLFIVLRGVKDGRSWWQTPPATNGADNSDF